MATKKIYGVDVNTEAHKGKTPEQLQSIFAHLAKKEQRAAAQELHDTINKGEAASEDGPDKAKKAAVGVSK